MPASRILPRRGSLAMAPRMRMLWLVATVITLSICYRVSSMAHRHGATIAGPGTQSRTGAAAIARCSLVGMAKDQCRWVKEHCPDEEAGLISYLQLYYCDLGHIRPIALLLILSWMCLLFTTIGIAASDFFSVNLSTIATLLGLSENLAGVTFLAFGNGSPDVFSTFAALSTHSGSLAIGELIGAAGFITAVVAGSMALVRPFRVSKGGFIRDVSFFIAASILTMVLLADGHLMMWECILMVSFYLLYVIVVVSWHWLYDRRSVRLAREVRARGHFLVQENLDPHNTSPTTPGANDGSLEALEASRQSINESFAALENTSQSAIDIDYDTNTQHQVISEINRNMRLNRPRHSRRPTANPIRPSLVGALEFRSVLSSLQKSRSQATAPINLRRYSDDPTFRRQENIQQEASNAEASSLGPSLWPPLGNEDSARYHRTRAVSVNDAAVFSSTSTPDVATENRPRAGLGLSLDTQNLAPGQQAAPLAGSLLTSTVTVSPQTAGSILAEMTPEGQGILRQDSGQSDNTRGSRSSTDHRRSSSFLLTPALAGSSPAVPFPPYPDDPQLLASPSRAGSFKLPPPRIDLGLVTHAEDDTNNSLRRFWWWPYSLLPEPLLFFSTLFPTLYMWRSKTIWGRILGVVAVPSILLLTITLPVVEEKSRDDDPGPEEQDAAGPMVPIVNVTEAEQNSHPPLITIGNPSEDTPLLDEGEHDTLGASGGDRRPLLQNLGPSSADGVLSAPSNATRSISEASASIENTGWNRWLVCIQVFMGPFFVMLLLWANTDDDGSIRNLLVSEAYTMISSLIVLAAILLLTDPVNVPKYRSLLCFVGFVVSVAWISTIANEVVGVLKALGVIFGISEAILGLTIFAVGNSLGDLVADITIARLGYPVMAFSACIGGPMLNILLGIGLGGLYMTIREGSAADVPAAQYPFKIEVGSTLMVSCIAVIVTLVGLLIAVPLNNWMMDRKIGIGLLALWFIATAINLAIEMSGIGQRHDSQRLGYPWSDEID